MQVTRECLELSVNSLLIKFKHERVATNSSSFDRYLFVEKEIELGSIHRARIICYPSLTIS